MLVRFAGAGVLHGGLRPSSCLGGLTNFLRLFNSGEALCAYHGERGKDRGPVTNTAQRSPSAVTGLYGPGTLLLLPSQLQTWPISFCPYPRSAVYRPRRGSLPLLPYAYFYHHPLPYRAGAIGSWGLGCKRASTFLLFLLVEQHLGGGDAKSHNMGWPYPHF